jgi:YD repeat-containing protein
MGGNTMRGCWQGNCLWALALWALSVGCHAQSATPDQEYQKLIQVDQGIQPLGEHPFGENINPYDGSLSFNVTDVSLRGNGPTITIGRTWQSYEWVPQGSAGPQFPFGSWDLDIPRIETLVGSGGAIAGSAIWQTGLGGITPTEGTTQRCTTFTEPPGIQSTLSEGGWVPDEWWYGYNLLVPGEGKQQLMPRYSANSLSPTISGMSFPIVTKNNWMVGCGVTASDGGEGFLAIAPDGTRYTFAHLLYRPYYSIIGAGGSLPPDGAHVATSSAASAQGVTPMVGGPGGIGILARRDALMYVTQIQDRFGNTLTYHYDPTTGYLSSITASDGREVDVTYVSGSPYIQTITAKAANVASRTWTYTYGSGLTGVQLPDGSAWSYQWGSGAENLYFRNSNCSLNKMPVVGDFGTPTTAGTLSPTTTGTMTAPSGLTATFGVALKLSGRSYTPQWCYGDDNGTHPVSLFPEWSVQDAITSEVLSGAGMPTQTWTYSYSPANVSWGSDPCATSGTCATTVYTDVTDPSGNDTRYTYSNRYDATEGLLLRTDTYSGAYGGTLKRSVVNTYANASGGAWPSVYGIDLVYRDNYFQSEQLSPVSTRTIMQDGQNYVWQAMAFDAYAQPIDVKRYNNIASQSSIEETTTYLNDTNLWLLGLPLQVSNKTTGEVESTNTYATKDTLLTRARFGQTLMHYTFNSAGQLASFTDGNGHTTTLGNYKRGVPQAIGYPDNTSETLTVDDFGQISTITDQAGHATSYSYDPVGRITGISYPSGDEVAWLPTTFAYSFVTGAERGVTANHWRRTTVSGNAKAVTYFDAMLRPVLSDTDIGSTVAASTLTTYDSKGQKVFSAYPSATALTFTQTPTVAGSKSTYDALGRVTQVQQDSELGTLTSSTAYLPGARQQVTDPKGNVTTTSYQVFDSPSDDTVIKIQAPAGITQAITRDLYGNPLSITQSGLYGATETDTVTKTLTYDSYHRLCRTTEPESGSEVMGYDDANNLAWSVSGATLGNDGSCHPELAQSPGVTTRTYDAMNRVLTIQPPAGTQGTTYKYDALGNVATTISGIAIQGFSHNFRGMLTNEALWIPSVNSSWSLTYNHDAYGSVSAVHYPDGETVSYAPDALGRPTQAGSYAQGVNYFANGQVKDFGFGNGATYVADQCRSDLKNCRQLLSNFSYGHGGIAQLSEDLDYDKNGNITAVTDLAGGPRTKAFGYDALNRLTSARSGGLAINETYAYDPLNNLRSRLVGGQTLAYNYDASNRLASITNGASALSSYVYDNRGNVINNNGVNLTFDQKNQLTQIGGTDTYAYDAAGRRVSKAAGGTTTYYLYSQAGQLMYQADVAALKSTNFIYLGRQLVARNVSAAPTLATPAISGTGNYIVSWNSISGATSYTLQEQVNGGSWTTIQSSSATSKAISGKTNGNYGYRVQTCNASTCGSWGSVASTTVIFPPPPPASITIPATSSGSVAVNWAASSTATSYTLQHANYGITGWSTAYNGSATSYTAHETVSGAWIYQVQACNAGGCSTYKVTSGGALVTIAPASAPSLTVPTTSYTGSYTVSWSGVAGATSYTLQEQVNGGAWATIQATSATSKALSGKGSGTYGYRVQGCNVSGCGPWSTTASISVLRVPAAPAWVSVPSSASYQGPGSGFAVGWASVSGATSYNVQRTTTSIASHPVAAVYTGTATSVTQLMLPGTYVYAAQACNASGCSGWTNSGTVTVVTCSAAAVAVNTIGMQPMIPKCPNTAATMQGGTQ